MRAALLALAHSALVSGMLGLAGCNNPDDRPLGVGAPERTAQLQGRQVTEASGIAPSLLRPGAFWLINDSGDTPTLYQFSNDGQALGSVLLENTGATDWEDCASFVHKGQPWLLVADTGDNGQVRASRRLIILPEPDPSRLSAAAPLRQAAGWVIEFRFPQGAADCEAVGVDATEQKIYLISKRHLPPALYSLPLHPPGAGGDLVAEKVTELPWLRPAEGLGSALPTARGRFANQPTGLSFSQDGRRAALLTYVDAWLFERAPGQAWGPVFATPGTRLAPHGLPQAEAICLSADGGTVTITSEGKDQPLIRYQVKTNP